MVQQARTQESEALRGQAAREKVRNATQQLQDLLRDDDATWGIDRDVVNTFQQQGSAPDALQQLIYIYSDIDISIAIISIVNTNSQKMLCTCMSKRNSRLPYVVWPSSARCTSLRARVLWGKAERYRGCMNMVVVDSRDRAGSESKTM